MAIVIRPFSADWRPAIAEFNRRLDAGRIAAGFRLPEEPQAADILPGSQVYLAVEERAVRGGYILRPQQFSFRGERRRVAHYRLPVSEGIINKAYALVGPLLLRHALSTEPLLYALGMGGYEHPLARMLKAMDWRLAAIPFYFRVVHPARFFRQIRALRKNRWRAALLDLAAWSGAGWVGIHSLQWARTQRGQGEGKEVEEFDTWADDVWAASQHAYGMAALRDQATLRQLYPASNIRFRRLQVSAGGWALVLDTPMREDSYFGNLRVGSIADCLAPPEKTIEVIHRARVYLEQRGVDLIISNQGHAAWRRALRADGFWEGPSNFILALSPRLSEVADTSEGWHINRGDGDGPVNL